MMRSGSGSALFRNLSLDMVAGCCTTFIVFWETKWIEKTFSRKSGLESLEIIHFAPEAFRVWLYKIAHDVATSRLRQLKRHQTTSWNEEAADDAAERSD